MKSLFAEVYPGPSHGRCTVNKDQINADLLACAQAHVHENVAR